MSRLKTLRRADQTGAVSIFVVIFTALLVMTISVGFVRLMVDGQRQATTFDLSRSAYDSAQAGVEDAKRALVMYRDRCQGSGAASITPECLALQRALTGEAKCDTLQQAGIAGSAGDKEVLIRQTEGDEVFQQAYTCVKVQMNTNDYIGELPVGTSRMIPLRAIGSYNEVVVEWYSQADLQDAGESAGVRTIDLPADSSLPKLADWPANRPAILRAQLIQYGNSFTLSDFDKKDDGKSNARTLFLLPNEIGRDRLSFADDVRQASVSGALQQVSCDRTFSSATVDRRYACKATIALPEALGATDGQRTAYLRLSSLYNNNTTFSIKLQQSGTAVAFNGVQTMVDSTGRANDLFRRVQSRIEIGNSSFAYPESAVEVSGSLCKTFLVTDNPADYTEGLCATARTDDEE